MKNISRRYISGFTLIELLVVVLIIGILSAVALPKYQKAVKRAQGVEARVAIKMWTDALNIYYLENGVYPDVLYYTLPLEEVNSILGISVSPLKYFNVGCQSEYTSPISCSEQSCRITIQPKSIRESIFCDIEEGKSFNFSDCSSSVNTTMAEDYGIKQ